MTTNTILILAAMAVVLVAAAIGAALVYRRQAERRRRLRAHFGPEYDRLAAAIGPIKAMRELEARQRRAASLHIHPLAASDCNAFADRWRAIQAEFVDNPKTSVDHADGLFSEVMAARGYPATEFEQRAADLSLDHPVAVQRYHAAHGTLLRHKKGQATTEDLRQAVIHYRALFRDLATQAQPVQPVQPALAEAAE